MNKLIVIIFSLVNFSINPVFASSKGCDLAIQSLFGKVSSKTTNIFSPQMALIKIKESLEELAQNGSLRPIQRSPLTSALANAEGDNLVRYFESVYSNFSKSFVNVEMGQPNDYLTADDHFTQILNKLFENTLLAQIFVDELKKDSPQVYELLAKINIKSPYPYVQITDELLKTLRGLYTQSHLSEGDKEKLSFMASSTVNLIRSNFTPIVSFLKSEEGQTSQLFQEELIKYDLIAGYDFLRKVSLDLEDAENFERSLLRLRTNAPLSKFEVKRLSDRAWFLRELVLKQDILQISGLASHLDYELKSANNPQAKRQRFMRFATAYLVGSGTLTAYLAWRWIYGEEN